MASVRTVVYLDACVIIEAHRTSCWKALASRFELHTVRECWEEVARGNPADPEYVPVDRSAIAKDIVVDDPTPAQVAAASLQSEKMREIQAGERDLLAWCAAQHPDSLLLTTGDRAAIIAACHLGLADRLRSLEELAVQAGSRPKLAPHYCSKWLVKIRTEFQLDKLS